MHEGDRNIHFFHKYASTRIMSNMLQCIRDGNGEWRDTTEDIHRVIVDYFYQLFTTSSLDERLSKRDNVQRVPKSIFQCIRKNHQVRMA